MEYPAYDACNYALKLDPKHAEAKEINKYDPPIWEVLKNTLETCMDIIFIEGVIM